ncbi:MAG: restriction endonuclease [Nakamurella sp.]
MSTDPIEFDQLRDAHLTIDRVYRGGSRGTTADDPIQRLLPVGNQGGFRPAGSPLQRTVKLCVLYTSGVESDWPDHLDTTSGDFSYFGDNRRPGSQLLSTRRNGNFLLQDVFGRANADALQRATVPPFFLFQKNGVGRDVIFRGLLAPGSPRLAPEEELVAVWRTTEGSRFQNYRAHFTVLDLPVVRREWILDILSGDSLGPECPEVWRRWVNGVFTPLEAPRSLTVRSRHEQIPASQAGRSIVQVIWGYFTDAPHRFEGFAADLWLMSDSRVSSIDVTRPSRDGGRDATGEYLIGPRSDPVKIDFALEAKCYAITNGVGVREVSRLISRLRARQFGILVTTSYLADQAYQEIREDGHPIVVIAARDIVDILSSVGIRTEGEVRTYLRTNHPLPVSPQISIDRAFSPTDLTLADVSKEPFQPASESRIRGAEPSPDPLCDDVGLVLQPSSDQV